MQKMEDRVRSQLRGAGLKATPFRLAILKLLYKSREPLDVQAILESFSVSNTPDQATVYRILESFVTSGLVSRVFFDVGAVRYELTSLEEHHHAVCTNCNRIENIKNCCASSMERTALAQSGFASIDRHSLEFFGLCKKCARN